MVRSSRLAAYDGGSGSILAAYGDSRCAGTGAADKPGHVERRRLDGALRVPAEAGPELDFVHTLIQYDEGSGNALFIAGQFAARWRPDLGQRGCGGAPGPWSPVTARARAASVSTAASWR